MTLISADGFSSKGGTERPRQLIFAKPFRLIPNTPQHMQDWRKALITMHEAGGVPVNDVIPDAIASAKRAIDLDPNDGGGYISDGQYQAERPAAVVDKRRR
jgi:hypothetical protein